jgi:hypothetical protein
MPPFAGAGTYTIGLAKRFVVETATHLANGGAPPRLADTSKIFVAYPYPRVGMDEVVAVWPM